MSKVGGKSIVSASFGLFLLPTAALEMVSRNRSKARLARRKRTHSTTSSEYEKYFPPSPLYVRLAARRRPVNTAVSPLVMLYVVRAATA
jgi:hypothetical protein